MQLIAGVKSGTTGTLVPLSVNASGELVLAGYDTADNASVIKSMQKKFRDSFAGSSVNTEKWAVATAGDMAISVSGGQLQMNSGVQASVESYLLSKETFTIPMRMTIALTLSQRLANQEFWVELVSVDSEGVPDGLNRVAWEFDGTTATQAKYVVQNSGVAPLISAAVTVTTTVSGGIYELEPFADESWFHSGVLDSTNARAVSYRRHQQSPDPNATYKLRLWFVNLVTPPASATTASIQYVCVTDYAELTAEITAGRGQATAGQAMGVIVTGGSLSTSESGLVSALTVHTNSAATTNAAVVKSTGGNLYAVAVTNQGASPVYVKLYNKATAPTVGTDVPVQTLVVPASSSQQFQFGRIGLRFASGIGVAITGAMPVADTTAVAAGQVQLSTSYI